MNSWRLQHPAWLILLLILPLMILYARRKRRARSVLYSSTELLRGLARSWRTRLKRVLPALHVAGLTLLIVGMARPQKGLQEYRVRTDGIAIQMCIDRSGAMLANEAADTVNQGVCSPADLDLAMEKGVNYPCGPLAWADAIGIGRVHRVLSNLAASYGEDRYRVSPRIAALHAAGRTFRP